MTNVTLKNSNGDSLYPKTTTENITDFDTAVETATADKANSADLAAVATSGSYTDLTGTPDLAAVATTGAYSDLTGTPSNVSSFTNDSGYLTAVPDEYVTEDELTAKGYLTAVPEEYVTETELTAKGYLTAVPEEYVTEDELTAKGYLTAVPDEYVTETELSEAISNIDTSGVSVDLSDYYTKEETDTALSAKQDVLTFDTTPTENSTNPVTSGGVYTAVSSLEEGIDSAVSNAIADIDLSSYIDIDPSSLSVDLSDYYTKDETDAAISAAITEAIGNVESGTY